MPIISFHFVSCQRRIPPKYDPAALVFFVISVLWRRKSAAAGQINGNFVRRPHTHFF